MFNLKLTDDYQNTSTYQVINFSISLKTENVQQVNVSSQNAVFINGELTLRFDFSNGHSVTYVIHTDDRAPDVFFIADFVVQEIKAAILNSWPLEINEYLERVYIYLGHQNSQQYNLKQFTANRI